MTPAFAELDLEAAMPPSLPQGHSAAYHPSNILGKGAVSGWSELAMSYQES